ncbi:MAG: hypothetical protein Q4D74_05145, partial [Comamonadaceae bacterium]|nr:hypothetical protein [Comamonadaceae bacterium]
PSRRRCPSRQRQERRRGRREMGALWQDPGAWIALGISALFLLAGFVMHRVFVKILKNPPPTPPAAAGGREEQARNE